MCAYCPSAPLSLVKYMKYSVAVLFPDSFNFFVFTGQFGNNSKGAHMDAMSVHCKCKINNQCLN